MPSKTFNSFEEAYQALTDAEIENDEREIPCVKIKTEGLPVLKIHQCSEYDYFYILDDFRKRILNYYANLLAREEREIPQKKLVGKINGFLDGMTNANTPQEIADRVKDMTTLFEDHEVRKYFFKTLKRLRVIPWYISWDRWQKRVRPHHTLTAFAYLWAFNFDGLKKKTRILVERITSIFQDTNSASAIGSKAFTDWDGFKKQITEGRKRVDLQLSNSKKSNT